MTSTQVVVIGGGQAGLAAGYYLRRGVSDRAARRRLPRRVRKRYALPILRSKTDTVVSSSDTGPVVTMDTGGVDGGRGHQRHRNVVAAVGTRVVPRHRFVADQRFWGRRMAAVGVAPPPIPHRRLTATAPAAALGQAISSPSLAAAATALGARARADQGLANTVGALEGVVSG